MNKEFSIIKKNTFYSTITIFSRLLANVILFWLLARFYGPERFGIFTFGHALATTFIILADFGLDVLLITEINSNPSNKKQIIEKLLGIKLIFVISAFVLMLVASFFFPISQKSFALIVVFAFYLVFTSLNNFLFGIFRGFERFIFEARVSLISNFSLVIMSLLLMLLNVELIYIAICFTLTRILGVLVSIIYLLKIDTTIKLNLKFRNLGVLKEKTLIFGLHLIFSYLFFQIDTLLLAKMRDEYSVGIYQSVMKLIMLPLVIPDILNNAMMPTLTRLHNQLKNDWFRLGQSMGRLLIIVIVPVTIVFYYFSNEIIDLIYGLKKYYDAVIVLQIFGLILFVRFLLEPFALMLTTSNRQKIRMITVIIATALNILLNLYFIPRYGVIGASIVSLIINSIVGITYFIAVEKEFSSYLLNVKNLFLLVFSLSLMIILVNLTFLSFFLKLMTFTMCYIVFVLFYYLTESEKEVFRTILNKIKLLL